MTGEKYTKLASYYLNNSMPDWHSDYSKNLVTVLKKYSSSNDPVDTGDLFNELAKLNVLYQTRIPDIVVSDDMINDRALFETNHYSLIADRQGTHTRICEDNDSSHITNCDRLNSHAKITLPSPSQGGDISRPPQMAIKCLTFWLSLKNQDALLGDIYEHYYQRILPMLGEKRATQWVWKEVVLTLITHGWDWVVERIRGVFKRSM